MYTRRNLLNDKLLKYKYKKRNKLKAGRTQKNKIERYSSDNREKKDI